MKDGHYIGLHTQVRYWLPKGGKYTLLEALISHTLDINEGKSFSINGYAKLWGWGRTKVRNFLHNLRTPNGHHAYTHQDTQRTSIGQGIVIKINNFDTKANTQQTSSEQATVQPANREQDTTIKNNNKNNKKPNKDIVEILDHLNLKASTNFKSSTKKTQQLIKARMNEGFTLENFFTVIDKKVPEWKVKPEMIQYIRPETLFGNKFEGYLNQGSAINNRFSGLDEAEREMEEKNERHGLQQIQ